MRLSVVDPGPYPPCPAPFNLAAYVLEHEPRLADKPALEIVSRDQHQTWTYREMRRAVFGAAAGLTAQGLPKGARVMLRIGNSIEFPLAFLACIAAGFAPMPTAAQLTGPEITKMAKEVSPALILASPGIALPDLPSCPVITAEEFTQLTAYEPMAPLMGDPNRLSHILFTSGSSGSPHPVMHAHRMIWARQMMYDGWLGLDESDRMLHAGALNWTFTLGTGLMDPWAVGATGIILADGTPPEDLPHLIDHHEATLFAAVPGIFRKILNTGVGPLPKLRHGHSAGEKLPTITGKRWKEATGTVIHEAFGMSECNIFISGSDTTPAPPGTLGYPQHGRRVAILDEDGQIVPRGAPGVISIHRDEPGLMLGYYGEPDQTAAKYDPSGIWFMTGDMGAMAEDNAISYLGRDDDMLNAGGFRVSPLEIEHIYARHPDLSEVAAVEVAVKEDAHVVALFYTSAADPSEADLKRFAQDHLAPYKIPRLFIRREALPRNRNGKLARRHLREEYQTTDG